MRFFLLFLFTNDRRYCGHGLHGSAHPIEAVPRNPNRPTPSDRTGPFVWPPRGPEKNATVKEKKKLMIYSWLLSFNFTSKQTPESFRDKTDKLAIINWKIKLNNKVSFFTEIRSLAL